MPQSLNGWAALQYGSDLLVTKTIPGTKRKITVHKAAAPLLLAAMADVHVHVIDLNPGPVDSFEPRDARLGGGISNHGSGTAIDFRYDIFKADHRRHMTGKQTSAMQAILKKFVKPDGERVLGWGGDWTLNKSLDEMHLEIGQAWQPGIGDGVSEADVKAAIKHLGIQPDGTMKVPAPPDIKHPVIHPLKPRVVHVTDKAGTYGRTDPGRLEPKLRWRNGPTEADPDGFTFVAQNVCLVDGEQWIQATGGTWFLAARTDFED